MAEDKKPTLRKLLAEMGRLLTEASTSGSRAPLEKAVDILKELEKLGLAEREYNPSRVTIEVVAPDAEGKPGKKSKAGYLVVPVALLVSREDE